MEARMPLIRTSSSKFQTKKTSLNRRHSEKLKNTSQIAPEDQVTSKKNEIMIANLLKSAAAVPGDGTAVASPTKFEEVKILIDADQKATGPSGVHKSATTAAAILFDMDPAHEEVEIDLDNLNFLNDSQTGLLEQDEPPATASKQQQQQQQQTPASVLSGGGDHASGADPTSLHGDNSSSLAAGSAASAHKVSFKKNKATRQLSNKYSKEAKLLSTSDASVSSVSSAISPSSSVSSTTSVSTGSVCEADSTCTSSSNSAASSPMAVNLLATSASKSSSPQPPSHHPHHVHRHKHGHKFYRRHEADHDNFDESVDDPDSISVPMGLSAAAMHHQFPTASAAASSGPRQISIILPPNYNEASATAANKVITLSRDATLKSSSSSLLNSGSVVASAMRASSSTTSSDKSTVKESAAASKKSSTASASSSSSSNGGKKSLLKRSHSDFIKTIKLVDENNNNNNGQDGATDASDNNAYAAAPVSPRSKDDNYLRAASAKMNNELDTNDLYKSELIEKNNELFNRIIESLKSKNKQLINTQLVTNALVHKSTPNLANLDEVDTTIDIIMKSADCDAASVGANVGTVAASVGACNFSSSLELTTNIFDLQKKLKQNLINSTSNLNRIQLLNNNYFNNSYGYYNDLFTVSYINSNQFNNRKYAQRYKLIAEGDVHVCRLPNTRNVISKILNSKLLRRWKAHRLVLTDSELYSTTKTDYMETNIPLMAVNEVSAISKWEPGQKYCLRVATFECHYLIQTNNVYLRDQWLHSIIWKKHKFKSERLLRSAERHDVIIKEIKHLIDMSMATPIDDNEVYQHPLELISEVLQKHSFPKQAHEAIIVTLSPLLEKNHPSPEICDFFSRHCRDSPRSHIVIEMFTPVVQRILKHNGDFGRYPRMRLFIQDYLMALISQNAGLQTVQNFVRTMHSPSSQCPFPRVLPNFVSVCLAAIHSCFEQRRNHKNTQPIVHLTEEEIENILTCYTTMMYTMSTFEDWRVNLAQLLQSVPFPDQAQTNQKFINIFKNVVKNFAEDTRCEVHQTLLGIREGKEGWFEIFCPGGISCNDDGELFTVMLKTLIGCCCKKKRFLLSINKLLSQLMVLAAKEVPCAIETLCAMLDLNGVENADNKLQIVSALQSTELGLKQYAKVCERQMQLKELQQKGGPRKLTMPSRSTDEDLAKLLMSGSFGNLECLSLAFTNVTSACAEYLIKLPSLRYLNLWSTKFGDQGLELISEHLLRLQVLNLCETPVTDKGLACLASMKQLRKLNLNSTNLSALTFEGLKECLPALQECDIRYTDAW